MPAYVIAYLEVTDPNAFQVYRVAAGPLSRRMAASRSWWTGSSRCWKG